MTLADPALVLVDLQKDYCTAGFAHDADSEVSTIEEPVARAGEFLDRYRASGRTPILVRTTHSEDAVSPVWEEKYSGRPTPGRPRTEGAEFAPELDVRPSDIVVTKHRYNAFYDSDIDTYLRSSGISRVLFGGVATNVCVETTLRGAFDRDYEVALLEDCCGSTEPELEAATLENVEAHWGEVIDSSEVDLPPVGEEATATATD